MHPVQSGFIKFCFVFYQILSGSTDQVLKVLFYYVLLSSIGFYRTLSGPTLSDIAYSIQFDQILIL